MLEFPQDYFKTEERSGYMVGETIKRIWASQIEILHKVIEICEKHDLQYFIFWGSLLGAVRHQGFIPWDDDLDIAMLGEDYVKLLEIADDELPQGYHIFNPYTDNELDIHFTRITNCKEIDLVGSWSKEYHGCPLSMGIDIFPLYYVPRDKRMAEEQKQILSFVKQLRDIISFRNLQQDINEEERKEYDTEIAQGLIEVQNITGYKFTSNRPIARQLDVIFDLLSRIATREESDCEASFDEYIVNNRRIYPISYFDDPIQLPFENIMVTAPREYDIILKDVYRDYMVPRNYNKMDAHAAVKAQMKNLGKQVEGLYFQKKNSGQAVSIRLQDVVQKKISYESAKELLPKDWLGRIYVTNSESALQRKKVLLYYLSVDKILFHSAHIVKKLKDTFRIFRQQPEIVVWWLPSMALEDIVSTVKNFVPETLEEYKELVKTFIAEDIGIYDESGDISRAIVMSDAYYGDEGMLVPIYAKTDKPIMIQDYRIYMDDTK